MTVGYHNSKMRAYCKTHLDVFFERYQLHLFGLKCLCQTKPSLLQNYFLKATRLKLIQLFEHLPHFDISYHASGSRELT